MFSRMILVPISYFLYWCNRQRLQIQLRLLHIPPFAPLWYGGTVRGHHSRLSNFFIFSQSVIIFENCIAINKTKNDKKKKETEREGGEGTHLLRHFAPCPCILVHCRAALVRPRAQSHHAGSCVFRTRSYAFALVRDSVTSSGSRGVLVHV